MQISEINLDKLKKVLLNLSKTNIKALYFADSLGALDIKKFKQLIQITNKYWKKDLGLHAHDNLNLALKNSEFAIKNNFRWIDSTIMGMGRGPGNLKTEEILKKVDKEQVKKIKILKFKYFEDLRKKYRWELIFITRKQLKKNTPNLYTTDAC